MSPSATELLTSRIPPHSAEAERAVLGSILLESAEAIARLGGLTPAHCYFERHRHILGAMMRLASRGEGIDLVTVTAELQAAGALEEAGGPVYLAQLVEEAAILAHLPDYARLVREAAGKRDLIRLMVDGMAVAYEPGALTGVLEQVQRRLAEIADQADEAPAPVLDAGPRPVGEVLDAFWDTIEQEETDFVGSPIPELNRRLGGGLLIGEIAVLGGRPGMSKTALAVQWAHRAASAGQPTLVVSREMKNVALAQRLLAQECWVPATAMRRRDLSVDERRRIERALPRLRALPLWFDDQATTIGQIRRRVKAGRYRFVVVDYMQLVRAPDAAKQQRRLEVTAVSAGLKAIAHDLACCSVLALSSLRRPNTEVVGKGRTRRQRRLPPTLEDLKESGDIEADADVVLLLWQPNDDRPDRELLFAKLRHGPTGGSTTLDWNPLHVRFTQLEDQAPAAALDPDDPRNEVPF